MQTEISSCFTFNILLSINRYILYLLFNNVAKITPELNAQVFPMANTSPEMYKTDNGLAGPNYLQNRWSMV